MNLEPVLAGVVALVEREGRALEAEFLLPGGPRGAQAKAPIDTEIELRLRAALQALVPCAFVGEETGFAPGPLEGWTWLIDPHDGTTEFLKARRGSSVSVGLVRGGLAVLGVVHSPNSPDLGADTLSWAVDCGPVRRNGVPVEWTLAGRALAPRERVWVTASAAQRPVTYSRGVAPARFVAMPSIAYRLARVAAGDGVAALTIHSVHEYDIAAGAALVRGAGGVLVDREGRDIVFSGLEKARVSGCFAGPPEVARELARFDWNATRQEERRALRVAPLFPALSDPEKLARGQGCLAGQLIGDSLGSLVAHGSAAEVAGTFPNGLRELADGGTWGTLAGQPAAAGELAITLARSILHEGGYDPNAVRLAYRHWIASACFEPEPVLQAALCGQPDACALSPGSLARLAPIGVWAGGRASMAASAARDESRLSHAHPLCVEACAALAAAISDGVGGGTRETMTRAALAAIARDAATVRETVEEAASERAPAARVPVLRVLGNAFGQLWRAPGFEEGLVASVDAGGDSGACGAAAGALLGALHGRDAVPRRWMLAVLACRPIAEADAFRPRPAQMWPDDVLDLAEALLRRSER